MLFLVYPGMIPPKSGPPEWPGVINPLDLRRKRGGNREDPEAAAEGVGEGVSTASAALKAEVYVPRIFGFKVHEVAKLQRWQNAVKERFVRSRYHCPLALADFRSPRHIAHLEELEEEGLMA